MTEFESIENLRDMVGKEVGIGDWFEVSQERINKFADATGDHQWIHIDVERAKVESPYKTTIAHGFLTLSLMSDLVSQTVSFRKPAKMGINYGLNKVRFTDAVPAGSRIRTRVTLNNLEDIPGGFQLTWGVTVEREGSEKPCLVAEWLGRRYE
ncbi:MAG: MaoC family dehydratase [Acidobacteria bacterium]|nr:MaoC family dehydratase [Acidobacteriota bacterium]